MKRLIALSLMVLAGCGSERGGGRDYITDLTDTIRHADRIVVTEHSSPLDFMTPESTEFPQKDEIVYGTRELTSSQKAHFLRVIEKLDPTTKDAFAACVPVVHHSIHFFAHEKLLSTMDVCFECGDVAWQGSKATPPWSLQSGLAVVVKDIGFQPERDWAALARAQ